MKEVKGEGHEPEEKQLHHSSMTVACGSFERRASVRGPRIYIRTTRQQQFNL
jgi:hypothetical protein